MTQRATPAARAQDFTGRKKAELAAEHAAEVKAREGEIALMNQAEQELLDEVVDTTTPTPEVKPEGPTELLELDGAEVVRDETKVIRIKEDCQPTFGAGNHYDFKEGRQYRVPTQVADHLEEKGLVYH